MEPATRKPITMGATTIDLETPNRDIDEPRRPVIARDTTAIVTKLSRRLISPRG